MKKIGVVIPVYNQALPLLCTLHGFLNQNISLNLFRIIVVDDGSTEDIESICNLFSRFINLTYKKLPRSGRAVSRNEGARELEECEIVIFCDADRIPIPGFIKNHISTHKNNKGSIVIGNIKDLYITDPWNNISKVIGSYVSLKGLRTPQYSQLVYKLFGAEGNSISDIPWIATFSGNMSFELGLFNRLRGFDPEFQNWGFEHFEFGYRAHKTGVPFIYNSRATNIHLSHPRGSYKNDMDKSHNIFYQKHPVAEVKNLKKFMYGKISLNELNRLVEGMQTKKEIELPNEYVKITNF